MKQNLNYEVPALEELNSSWTSNFENEAASGFGRDETNGGD